MKHEKVRLLCIVLSTCFLFLKTLLARKDWADIILRIALCKIFAKLYCYSLGKIVWPIWFSSNNSLWLNYAKEVCLWLQLIQNKLKTFLLTIRIAVVFNFVTRKKGGDFWPFCTLNWNAHFFRQKKCDIFADPTIRQLFVMSSKLHVLYGSFYLQSTYLFIHSDSETVTYASNPVKNAYNLLHFFNGKAVIWIVWLTFSQATIIVGTSPSFIDPSEYTRIAKSVPTWRLVGFFHCQKADRTL